MSCKALSRAAGSCHCHRPVPLALALQSPYKIFPPHLGRIEIEFVRHRVHEPLDGIGRLRASGTTVGIGSYFVREHGDLLDFDGFGIGRHPP